MFEGFLYKNWNSFCLKKIMNFNKLKTNRFRNSFPKNREIKKNQLILR